MSLCYVVAALCALAPNNFASLAVGASTESQTEYDIVILNGRVIDPESRLDAIRNVGITNGKIQAISEKNLLGRTTIQATGLVIAPGFIDLHSHRQDQENYRFKAMGRSYYGPRA